MHCIAPSGDRICYDSPYRKDRDDGKTKCGGQLDVDMTSLPDSKQAIENIYWMDGAPCGKYVVSVVLYSGSSCPFDLIVCGGGVPGTPSLQAQEIFRGVLVDRSVPAGYEGNPEKFICEFEFVSSSEPLKFVRAIEKNNKK